MMILPLALLLIGIGVTLGKLEASTEQVFLQPGETRIVTLVSNSSKWSNVFLRTKLHHIASVSPERYDMDPSHPWWEVQIMGHQLGYTYMIAAINESNSFSFEEGVVHIIVLKQYWLQTLSLVCGWIYFSAWTFSFYPQLLSNIRRKSVVGLNFDFLGLNELGYICYSIFNCCLLFVPSIQEEYFRRHPGATNPVFLNDVLFSVHGLFATTVMIIHCFIYERGEQTMSRTGVALLSFGICATCGLLLAATQGCLMSWLDAIVWISFIKLIVTMTKYVPQVLMNYRLKSTEGWSIECTLCDLTGSTFSILQMLIISYNCDDWVSIAGDPTKFGLGLFSVGFDMIFIVQHFILYRSSPEKEKKEKEPPKSIFSIFRKSILPTISRENKK